MVSNIPTLSQFNKYSVYNEHKLAELDDLRLYVFFIEEEAR